MNIPFTFVPPKVLAAFSKSFYGVGTFATLLFPLLQETLWQAESELSAREYAAQSLLSAVINAMFIFIMLLGVGSLGRLNLAAFAVAAGVVVFFASFLTALYHPRIVARRRARKVDRQLIPALRQMLIQLKSGVPLFNAMASLTNDYGEVSKEFRKIIRRVNTGVSELDALNDATLQNPSLSFRRALWQLSNALKVGSDLAKVLEGLVDELTRERLDQIRSYGQELSPWAMMYMMLAVILPSLGVTMLLVIATFLNISLPSILLGVIVFFLIIFQVFFMNFVASRRPSV